MKKLAVMMHYAIMRILKPIPYGLRLTPYSLRGAYGPLTKIPENGRLFGYIKRRWSKASEKP